MSRHIWLVLAVLGGCRQVLGIQDPIIASDAGDDASDAIIGIDGFEAGVGCFGHAAEDVVCFSVIPTGDVILASVTLDADSAACSTTVTSGPFGCVIAGSTIRLEGAVKLIGSKPVVFVGVSSIEIVRGAEIDASSHIGATAGPGNNAVQCSVPSPATNGGGGAGGSFGGAGGNGGNDHDNVGRGLAAPALVPTTIHGGCRGGDGRANAAIGGVGGNGGGAVLLIASTIILDGVINASGAGGVRGPPGSDTDGAGGGGSGGMIAIDAATLTGIGTLVANGGGGGGGTSAAVTGGQGSDPNPSTPTTGALGGGGTVGAKGGDGGAGLVHAGGAPLGGVQNGAGGGGGGGGTGVLQFFATTFTSGTVSPQ